MFTKNAYYLTTKKVSKECPSALKIYVSEAMCCSPYISINTRSFGRKLYPYQYSGREFVAPIDINGRRAWYFLLFRKSAYPWRRLSTTGLRQPVKWLVTTRRTNRTQDLKRGIQSMESAACYKGGMSPCKIPPSVSIIFSKPSFHPWIWNIALSRY